jgi:pimeloyl-ACP methyl ester carboxylesterase
MILNGIDQGAGPPVILLHGLFGAAKNLGAIARALSGQTRVISLDLRNHGASPHAATMDYEAMAADVAETAAAMGIAQAAVIGHSMGGKTAMALALTRPAFVQRLMVLDIAPVTYNHGYDSYVRAMKSLKLSPALTRQAADAALATEIPEPAFRAFLLNNLVLGDQPHWRAALDEIGAAMSQLLAWADPPGAPFTGPALFVRGEKSDYVRDAAFAKIGALFPQYTMETVKNAGHWLHAEQPGAVISALERFLFA